MTAHAAPVCSAQEQSWWNQKCADCGHNLMLHESTEADGLACSMCELRALLKADISGQAEQIERIRVAFNELAAPLSYPEIAAPETPSEGLKP